MPRRGRGGAGGDGETEKKKKKKKKKKKMMMMMMMMEKMQPAPQYVGWVHDDPYFHRLDSAEAVPCR